MGLCLTAVIADSLTPSGSPHGFQWCFFIKKKTNWIVCFQKKVFRCKEHFCWRPTFFLFVCVWVSAPLLICPLLKASPPLSGICQGCFQLVSNTGYSARPRHSLCSVRLSDSRLHPGTEKYWMLDPDRAFPPDTTYQMSTVLSRLQLKRRKTNNGLVYKSFQPFNLAIGPFTKCTHRAIG